MFFFYCITQFAGNFQCDLKNNGAKMLMPIYISTQALFNVGTITLKVVHEVKTF